MSNFFGFFGSKGGGDPTYVFTVVTAGADTFQLPLEITGTYDFHVDWGDTNTSDITVYNHADTNHSYAGAGTYEVRITGTITGWRFNNGGDKDLIHEIKSWGPLRLGNSGGYFFGCVNMTVTATDILDLTGTTSGGSFFYNCDSITTIPSINSWDWSNIENMNGTFQNMTLFNQDLSGLDVSNVTAMRFALSDTLNFDQDLGSWNVSSLIDATTFFQNVTLSVANYDALIINWSAQVPSGAYAFHGGNSKYTGGGTVATARAAWVTKGWTLTDNGENLGVEKITDGVFAANCGVNWACNDTVIGAGVAVINSVHNYFSVLLQDFTAPLVDYKTYRLTFDVTAYTSGTIKAILGDKTTGDAFTNLAGGMVYADEAISYTWYATHDTIAALDKFEFLVWSIGGVMSIDNISIKECL